MEVKGATFLYTLAGLMISFAGFSALLLTPSGRWSEVVVA